MKTFSKIQVCRKCKVEVNKYNAHKRNDGQPGFYTICKKCQSFYITKNQKLNKERAVEYKGGKCIKCGYNKYIGALEFHHRDRNKKDNHFSRLLTRGWENLKKEVDKCDLVCSNCHREIEFELRNLGSITQ